jgi:ferredoxin
MLKCRMGHLAPKDAYRDLGRAIDGLTVKVPWNETLRAILRELYTEEEAALVSRMPTGLASFRRVSAVTGFSRERLRPLLTRLASKGLVMDLLVGGVRRYTVSPFVIGIFEFTMMRTDGEVDLPHMAAVFHDYLNASGGLFEANFGHGERFTFMRTLAHEDALSKTDAIEVLDHDKAGAIVNEAGEMAVGACSCRHEKMHLGDACGVAPLQSCISFGSSGYMTRRRLARTASKAEVRDLLAMAAERRLVLNADSVRTGVSFLCLCCGCCCNVLGSIRKFGLSNIVVTSGYMAAVRSPPCTGCGKCARACPIEAIEMTPQGRGSVKRPRVDESFCIGCGVCALSCPSRAMTMEARKQRALLPENTVERVILQALERGNLQNFLIDNPNLGSSRFLRAVISAFLGLSPVRRAIMSDTFRSVFLSRIAAAIG